MAEFENPSIRLKRLTVGVYNYTLILQGINEEIRLNFEVIAYPTSGTYHIKFTNALGMDSETVKHLIKFKEMVFTTDSIIDNTNTTKISVTDVSSGISIEIDNILFVTKEEIDNSPTKEDYIKNESFQNMVKQNHKIKNRTNKQSSGFSISKWLSSKIK